MDEPLNMILSLLKDEKRLFQVISLVYIVWAIIIFLSLQFVTAPYGRYSSGSWGFGVNPKFAWVVQEMPSFIIPIYVLFFTDCPKIRSTPNLILSTLFLLHYFQRSFIFPFLIKGGKPTPFITFLMAVMFCGVNGYLQVGDLAKYEEYGLNWLSPRFCCGLILFFIGMFINIQSDGILRNLRKPGETGYKIPKGGMFDYVSGANFLGEIVEWSGFALAAWSLPSFVFAFFTCCNIGPRAIHHHRWYKKKFEDYPRDRKALIPFIL
ncbi:hypothetical protein SNE40_010604 [Patella caerulea]|uniref:3-oxo-5alpha-steroid 4-dehydrogenase (NADP(+)) n=1 Tax=Patella caerulea TaxID=87958 RepID=A0AAN8JTR8_PATCE